MDIQIEKEKNESDIAMHWHKEERVNRDKEVELPCNTFSNKIQY